MSAVKVGLAVLTTPVVAVSGLLLVLGGAGADASPSSTVCGGAGTGATVAGVTLDAEQLGNAHTIVTVTADRQLPAYAAVVAVTTAYTESRLHNSTVQTDHDSEGLFQQRISIYGKRIADDPVQASVAFLHRLVAVPNWTAEPVGIDAQAVQVSRFPQRYQLNAAVGEQIAGLLWPTAVVTTGGRSVTSGPSASARPGASVTPPAICAGAGGVGKTTGPTGDDIAGTTTIPDGFAITGSMRARIAVRFALAQLGKPYVFGAAGPQAWDCSGLTMGAWAAAGVALPHWTVTQAGAGTPTSLANAVGGDLVFIPGSDGTAQAPGHVGIVAGSVDRTDGRRLYLVQAPMTGVPVELTEVSQWSGQIVAVRHVA